MALPKAEKNTEESRVVHRDLRYYGIDKDDTVIYYPSVTTILNVYPKEFIHEWRAAVGIETATAITNQALAKGSRVHRGAECLINGMTVICDPIGRNYFTPEERFNFNNSDNVHKMNNPTEFLEVIKVKKFLQELNAKNVFSEKMLYSVVHEFAGTADIILYIPESGKYTISGKTPVYLDEGWYLVDIKTGKNVSNTAKYQLSAYIVALEEMYNIKFTGAMIAHTNSTMKSGIVGFKAIVYEREELKNAFKNFKIIQQMFLIDNPTPKPKDISFEKSVKYDIEYDKHALVVFGGDDATS